jgi:SPP1 family predicted phage head-tail adaptor
MANHRVGELDQRINITRESSAADSMGGGSISLDVIVGAYAKVRAKSGNERVNGDKVEAPANYTFTIRNRSDITIQYNDRISWDGVQYNIRFVRHEGLRALFLELDAERGVAQ